MSWNALSNITRYELQQKIGTGSWVQVYSSANRTWPADSMLNGTYKYRVRACNATGCSAYSSEISVRVLILGGGGDCFKTAICR